MLAICVAAGPVVPAYAGRVFVDPGHGGPYPGAVQGGVAEEYVNLLLGLAVRDALIARGHTVAMSRTTDTSPGLADRPTWHYLTEGVRYYADGLTGVYKYDPAQTGSIPYDDLQARCDMANAFGSDVFVSIHCDSSTSTSARGTATYRNWDNETDRILSDRLAGYVQSSMMSETSPYYSVENDGVRVVGFYVVRWANMPAILVESAFLSNPYERSLLLNPAFRIRLANGIANGITRFLDENPFTPRWDRIAGGSRYDTAARIAEQGWPTGADTVLLASGQNWPDALSATPLSAHLNAPLLLTSGNALPPETAAALSRIRPDNIVVLGGTAAIDDTTTASAAGAAGIPLSGVRRIAGADRFETSALIAREIGVAGTGRVLFVSGSSFADALSVSSYAGRAGEPILLLDRDRLPSPVHHYLLDNDHWIRRAWIIGGTGAVSSELYTRLQAGSDYGLEPLTLGRIAGADRYQTNAKVIASFWPTGAINPYVATAVSFPDALSAGTLGARHGEPIMLLGGRFMSGYTREFLVNGSGRIGDITMVGGSGALPYLMDWQIEKGLAR